MIMTRERLVEIFFFCQMKTYLKSKSSLAICHHACGIIILTNTFENDRFDKDFANFKLNFYGAFSRREI